MYVRQNDKRYHKKWASQKRILILENKDSPPLLGSLFIEYKEKFTLAHKKFVGHYIEVGENWLKEHFTKEWFAAKAEDSL